MAFILKVSNSLEQLCTALCTDIKLQRFSVFQPVSIVTQTEGMNNWLKLSIADKLGIAANIDFLRPNELINTIYKILGEKFEQALDRETITWHLYTELGKEVFIGKFPAIARYYQGSGEQNDVKRIGLAQKLADLFDQYQVYRTDMVAAWNEDKDPPEEEWQQYLWQQLKQNLGKGFADKTEIGQAIGSALSETSKAERLKERLPVIYFFGISIFTAYHLQILQNVAEKIDVQFLLLNPAPGDYWFEDMPEKKLIFYKQIGKIDKDVQSEGNSLLLSWGNLLQHTYAMLFQHEDILNGYEELPGIYREKDSLLHSIQAEIANNEKTPTNYINPEMLQDHSLLINSCFTPLKEVEAFYNYLVYLLHVQKQDIKPTDIVVMVGDIDLYAPYIKAVFDNAPTTFRYSIADEKITGSDAVLQALDALLQLREAHLTAENVIRLLDNQVLRESFGISDVELIRSVVQDANIRFGLQNSQEDESVYVSWKYGLQRIMYGIAMSGADVYGSGDESFYPLDRVEGSRASEVISFVHLAELLITMVQEKYRDRTVAAWVEFVQEIVRVFLGVDSADHEDLALIEEKLEAYNEVAVSFTESISFEVFLQNFDAGVMNTSRQQQFLQGGISFCSLIPMRSIPFKVVAMLGLNFNSFPRKEQPISFDLMTKQRRKGDRNIKENDKHLFLETLLSAEEYFYLSYVGQDVNTLAEKPPSAVVDELIAYIGERLTESSVSLPIVNKQPLYSYSGRYTNNEYAVYNFLGRERREIMLVGEKTDEATEPSREISLSQLISFLNNPIEGYYKEVLNIYYDETEAALADTEVFDMDNLQQWAIKNELLHLEQNELPAWEMKARKLGQIPLKNMGTVAVENTSEAIETVKASFKQISGSHKPVSVAIELLLGEMIISGNINDIYDDKNLVVSFSKHETKYIIRAYINALALSAAKLPYQVIFLSNNGETYTGEIPSADEATRRLISLLDLYRQAHENLVPFATGLKIDMAKLSDDTAIAYSKAIKDSFETERAFSQNSYLQREYQHGLFDDGLAVFEQWAAQLLLPLKDFLPGYYE